MLRERRAQHHVVLLQRRSHNCHDNSLPMPDLENQPHLRVIMKKDGQEQCLYCKELNEDVDAWTDLRERHAQDASHEGVGVRLALLTT
jgi:hypothetical protein